MYPSAFLGCTVPQIGPPYFFSFWGGYEQCIKLLLVFPQKCSLPSMMTIVGFAGDQEDDALALRDVPLRGVSLDNEEDDESLELVLQSSSEPDESEKCFLN